MTFKPFFSNCILAVLAVKVLEHFGLFKWVFSSCSSSLAETSELLN